MIKTLLALLLTAGLVIQAPAITQTLVETNSTGYLITDVTDYQLAIPAFDSALGQLTSVSLQITMTTETSWIFEALAGTALGSAASSTSDSFSIGNLSTNQNYRFPTFSFSGLKAVNTTNSPEYVVSSTIEPLVNVAPLSLPSDLYLTTSTSSSVRTSGNVHFSQSTEAEATVEVVYIYNPAPTPEPSTLALAGLGVAAWWTFRKRR